MSHQARVTRITDEILDFTCYLINFITATNLFIVFCVKKFFQDYE